MGENTATKPLFIPLKREYFEAFESGDKTHELRLYGPRWNERNCPVGRPATLSLGYGKHRRLHGVVSSFERVPSRSLSEAHQQAIASLYGPGDHDIARIGIELPSTNTEQSA